MFKALEGLFSGRPSKSHRNAYRDRGRRAVAGERGFARRSIRGWGAMPPWAWEAIHDFSRQKNITRTYVVFMSHGAGGSRWKLTEILGSR
jgi:hypothetical protein